MKAILINPVYGLIREIDISEYPNRHDILKAESIMPQYESVIEIEYNDIDKNDINLVNKFYPDVVICKRINLYSIEFKMREYLGSIYIIDCNRFIERDDINVGLNPSKYEKELYDKELMEWMDYILNYADIYSMDYIGYWARRVAKHKDFGSLLWLFEDDDRFSKKGYDFIPGKIEMLNKLLRERGVKIITSERDEAYHAPAVASWLNGELSPYYVTINKEIAKKAFDKGIERYGHKFLIDRDANMEDVAIQLAIFDEVVYG